MMNCRRAGGSLKAALSLPRPLQRDWSPSFISHHFSFIISLPFSVNLQTSRKKFDFIIDSSFI